MLAVSALNYPGGEALAYVRGVAGGGTGGGAVVPVHADVLACMTGVTLFGTGTRTGSGGVAGVAGSVSSSSPASGAGSGKGSGIVKVKQQDQGQDGVRIVVDKTEDDAVLASADFWSRFDYVLVEDRSKVVGGEWETVGVVKGYGGIEVVKRGGGRGDDRTEKGAPRVVGLGETVALWKRTVRDLTGGWWIGPRMVERIFILRRVKEAPTAQRSSRRTRPESL